MILRLMSVILGWLESLWYPLPVAAVDKPHQKMQIQGAVSTVLKESGSKKPVRSGKRMDLGIRQAWLCHLALVCSGAYGS